jgi:hypothetical protein
MVAALSPVGRLVLLHHTRRNAATLTDRQADDADLPGRGGGAQLTPPSPAQAVDR